MVFVELVLKVMVVIVMMIVDIEQVLMVPVVYNQVLPGVLAVVHVSDCE
jgi:hypothetical protein